MTTFFKWFEWITISGGINNRTVTTYNLIMDLAMVQNIKDPIKFIRWVDFMNDL